MLARSEERVLEISHGKNGAYGMGDRYPYSVGEERIIERCCASAHDATVWGLMTA